MNGDPSLPSAKERDIFLEALDQPTPEARSAYLDRVCGDDHALRASVEALLRNYKDDNFLEVPSSAMSRPDPLTEKPGDAIGPYKLLEKIGEGGFGAVYVAEQREPIRRRVALKIIKLGMDTKQVVARFEAERQALAMMEHPNIAKVLEAGATDTGRPFFVMELVRGITITDYCDQNQLSTRQRLDLFIQICHAVQHAHQKGVIHRDIKPSNILVTLHDGVPVPKVIDFGIAKATQGHLTDKTVYTEFRQFIGTPAYMSPEQAEMSGLDIDTRTDLYSLGVLLYQLLTGQTPFDAKELLAAGLDEMRRTIREREPLRPSTRLKSLAGDLLATTARQHGTEPLRLLNLLHGDLDWIVMKCLEKDRTRRYDSASGLAMDIQRHVNHEPVLARPPSNLYRFHKFVRRNKLEFGAVCAVAAALVIGLVISITAKQAAQAQASRAELAQAVRLVAEDYRSDALTYLVRSLSSDPGNSSAVTRLTTLLAYHSWMLPSPILRLGDRPMSAQFSPDGKRIVTASNDGTARVWDAQSGQLLTEPLKHTSIVCTAQFSPDGKRIVTASNDGTARLWDACTGRELTEPLTHLNGVKSAQFSPDGLLVVTASGDNTARVWSAQTGRPLTQPLRHGSNVASAQFSPDSQSVVTTSDDHTARIWNAHSGQPLTGPLQHRRSVDSAQFSPDGTRVVTASWDGTAQVWDAHTGQPVNGPLMHGQPVLSAQFSPDGTRIVTGCMDAMACVWNAKSGQQITGPLKHLGQVCWAQFSPDGTRVVTASFDDTARVWDAQRGQPLSDPLKHGERVTSAQFSPDGRRILTAAGDGRARVWGQFGAPALPAVLNYSNELAATRFSPDGTRIIEISPDGTAQVWDAKSNQPLTPPLRHKERITSANLSPDGRWIVTASRDATARVWSSQDGHALAQPMRHSDIVASAQFSPDGSRIVTASMDYTARVWDAQTGQPLTQPLWHPTGVNSAEFSPDGKQIVTACNDGTARIWDAQTGQLLTDPFQHSTNLLSAEFTKDGKQIVTTASDHTMRRWDIGPSRWSKLPEWLPALVEAISGQRLNEKGVMEETKLNRVETLNQIRRELEQSSHSDDWTIWGRWFLADPATRTISPFSKVRVPE
jgi:WD40 repeat protein/serine/threonine protein kinase